MKKEGLEVPNERLSHPEHQGGATNGPVCHFRSAVAGLKTAVQVWAPQHETGVELLERVQQWAGNTVRGLELIPYEERLRDLGLFNLMKINKYLKGGC